jgi:RHS repeat-associated protein
VKKTIALNLSLLLLASLASAQDRVTEQILGGTGGSFERVDVRTGGLNLKIPIFSLKGRGVDYTYDFNYTSKIWHVGAWNIPGVWPPYYWTSNGTGWTPGGGGSWNVQQTFLEQCSDAHENHWDVTAYTNVMADDGAGIHQYPTIEIDGGDNCTPYYQRPRANVTTAYASDGSGTVAVLPFSGRMKNGAFPNQDTNGNLVGGYDTGGRPVPNYGGMPTSLAFPGGYNATITWQTIQANTNFAAPSNAQQCPQSWCTIYVITRIELPGNRVWQFEYAPNSYGQLTKVTLPSGAYVRYEYQTKAGLAFGVAGGEDILVVSKRVLSADGMSEQEWNYTYTQDTSDRVVTEIDPIGNKVVHTYERDDLGFEFAREVLTESKNSSNVTKQKVARTYYACDPGLLAEASGGENGVSVGTWTGTSGGCRLKDETLTIYDTSPVSKRVSFEYDSFNWTYPDVAYGQLHYTTVALSRGNIMKKIETDWGAGETPGAVLRSTEYQYLTTNSANGNIDYSAPSINIADRVTVETVKNANNIRVAETTYEYDGSVLVSTSGVPQHDYNNYPSTNRVRGNVTQIKKWVSSSGWGTFRRTLATNTYDDLGNLLATSDELGHTTTFSYTSDWSGSGCLPPAESYLYPTQITNAAQHRVRNTYYACSGMLAATKDENDILASRAGVTYQYDIFRRPNVIQFPDGGETDYFYPSLTQTEIKQKINDSNQWTDAWILTDGMGRELQSAVAVSAPDNWVIIATCYDAVGRVYKKTYPVYSAGGFNSSPCSNLTGDIYTYDVLNRVTAVTYQDGNSANTYYDGQWTTSYDEIGNGRILKTDGLGRIITAIEPNAAGSSWDYYTNYVYNAANNLIYVEQRGGASSAEWRTRSFSYDGLGRVTSATNPESGTATYSYVSAAGTLCSGDPSAVCQQTDARGITATFNYDDPLNRLTSRTYSDSTPSAFFAYDQTSVWGYSPIENPKGRLTYMAVNNNGTVYSYDSSGNVILQLDCRVSNCGLSAYWTYPIYNKLGQLSSLRYPSGRRVDYTYDIASRLINANFDNWSGSPVNYNYYHVNTFAPHGGITSATFGNQLVESNSFNSRLQLTTRAVSVGTRYFSNKNFWYYDANNKNNGNILAITDSLWHSKHQEDQGRDYYYSYDALNRIKKASEGVFDPNSSGRWGYDFAVDPWGNLTAQSVFKGTATPFSSAAASNNRLVGYGYDASGNTTQIGSTTYSYDAENRLQSAGGVSYLYGPDGNRGRKASASSATEYIYLGDQVIAERNLGPTLDSSMLSQSGLTAYYAGGITDQNPGSVGWHTDASVAGSWLKIDFGSPITLTYLLIYASTGGYSGNYSFQYSDDNTNWGTATTITPSNAGWNGAAWSWGAVGRHRYWRLYLNNTPGAGSWLTELAFLSEDEWSDYIYAGNQRIAKADNFANRLILQGTCTNCAGQGVAAVRDLPTPASLQNYLVQNGDMLYLRQWQTSNARGGIMINFTDGSCANWVAFDQDGNYINADSVTGAWHTRKIDLSQFASAGKRIASIQALVDNGTSNGWWAVYYMDISIVATDGDVHTIYNGQRQYTTTSGWSTPQMSSVSIAVDHISNYPSADQAVTYFHSDHLGSSTILSSGAGWPVHQCSYAPFGQAMNCSNTSMADYEFAAMERDTESSTDHTRFRQYSFSMGRWLTPDPIFGEIRNPQSFNRYAYVLNNPLRFVDPLGLEWCTLGQDGSRSGCISDDLCKEDPEKCKGKTHVDPKKEAEQADWMSELAARTKKILLATKKKICENIPDGRSAGATGTAGAGVAGVVSMETVINWNTGEISNFYSAGQEIGVTSPSIAATGGAIYNLGNSNANYSGPFLNLTVAYGALGITTSYPTDVQGHIKLGPTVTTTSLGVSAVPFTMAASRTFTSSPEPAGSLHDKVPNPHVRPRDFVMLKVRKVCQ